LSESTQLTSIVIPMYNELEAIGDELELITATMEADGRPYEIIVVDDGSTDGSTDVVRQWDSVRLIQFSHNRGTGAARTAGMQAAQGEVVIMTDADGTYPNQDMPRLLDALECCDMVIGARKREAGSMRWLRTPAKTSIRLLASYLAGMPIPDLNSGFRAFRRDVAMRYLNVLPNTHSWVSTLTLTFLTNGYTVNFMPIDYYPRKGRSKFHPLKDTYNYLMQVIRTVMYFNPLKIFLPLSAAIFLFGTAKLIHDLFLAFIPRIRESTVILLVLAFMVLMNGLLADLIVTQHRQVD
jgi:glycosyltransferase involved in cell wall biosynthesis